MRTFNWVFFLLFTTIISVQAENHLIDLSGTWKFSLDTSDIGLKEKWFLKELPEQINLPGTTDLAGKGFKNTMMPKLEKPQVLHLTRKFSYVGAAWYSRKIEIPRDWTGKPISLLLERVLWQSQLWIDGREVKGVQESLTTPHRYYFPEGLSAGNHTLTLRIDNRKLYDISVNDMAHAYTNETQIMWNGVLGRMELQKEDIIQIKRAELYPNIKTRSVKVVLTIQKEGKRKQISRLGVEAFSLKDGKVLPSKTIKTEIKEGLQKVTLEYPMGANPLLWSEFTPDLYEMRFTLKSGRSLDKMTSTFGMREITNNQAHLQINGNRIFLRGTLECCIFPLTGTPPTNKKDWERVFLTAKEWGLNHLRFHSWCPPEAAFEVADEMGFYLQIELPLWSLTVNKDQATDDFLYAEADRMINEYGNHPSFCFWSLGNELQPDFEFLNAFLDKLKAKDPRHLYTNTSYTFEKGHGAWPERNDDYFITQTTKKGWVRGQGVFDSEKPKFSEDYAASVSDMPVPIISHEIGQYAVYPNTNEIDKYVGVLDPLNFKAVKADLIKKGTLSKANDYLMASGKLAAILYKEEIERTLKTSGISGFQLLDLHDFPGQGTALVGLLDAFWDSKGLISSASFRQFCSPVVPLIRYEKAIYTNDEIFDAAVEIVNYGSSAISDKKLDWKIEDSAGTVIGQGDFKIPFIAVGEKVLAGNISNRLSSIAAAGTFFVKVRLEDTPYENEWQIWVYPAKTDVKAGDVIITANRAEALSALSAGKKVLFSPKIAEINGLEGKFVQVFWSPVHFPNQPGTMGLLMDPKHPALRHFPTEMHTNWQWWDLCKQSKTLCVDSIPNVNPIVENVDNFMKNRKLCSVFEAKVGQGQLLFSSMDLLTDTNNRPAARQLLLSLVEYMKTGDFHPENVILDSEMMTLLH